MIPRLTIDCFHLSPEVQRVCAELADQRVLARSRITLRPGGLPAAVGHYAEAATPQLVVVEEAEDDQAMLERLGRLAEVCVAGTRVVVIGRLNDVSVYRTLLARGVSEYLVSPLGVADLVGAIESIFADPAAVPRGRVIGFFGARGGVGSSCLAHHAAWALAENTEDEVILLDLDLGFGTSGLAFNMEVRQTVGELLGEPDRLDALLLDRLLVRQSPRLSVLPSPSALRDWPAVEPEVLDRLLDLVRQAAPLVVVDLPHLWAPWIRHALETVDELVIVAQPDLPNLRDVKTLLEALGPGRGDKAPPRLVLNKLDAYRKTQLAAKDFEETLKLKPSAGIPFEPLFGTASNNGQMLGEIARSHKIVGIVQQLALQLGGRTAKPARRRMPAWNGLPAWLKKPRPVR